VATPSTSASDTIRALEFVTNAWGYPETLRLDRARANSSLQLAEYAKRHNFLVVLSPAHAHFTLGQVETRNRDLAAMAVTVFGESGAAQALVDQSSLNQLSFFSNAALNSNRGTTPYRALRGYDPPTPLTVETGVEDFLYPGLPSSFSGGLERFANSLAGLQELVATGHSTAQLVDAASRDAARAPPTQFDKGDLVTVHYPGALKLQSYLRGPFVVDSHPSRSWYSLRRLEDIGNASADTFQCHSSRIFKFNASRTTIEALMARSLSDDYGVVTAVTAHRLLPDGQYEFTVVWADGDITQSTADPLSRVTVFKNYVAAHGLVLDPRKRIPSSSQCVAVSNTGPPVRGRGSRGRGRGSGRGARRGRSGHTSSAS